MVKTFVFEYITKDDKRKRAAVRSKHLQGAIRRLYAERNDIEQLSRILES